VHVRAPEGSVLNCRYPAAVNQRTMVGWFCGPALFRALAPVLPDRVQAFTGLPVAASAYGRDATGGVFNDHIMFGGGQGGSQHGDGISALMYPTSAANVSVEMFEQRTPLVVVRKALLPDTGGPGAQRGGLGQQLVLRKLHDDGLPVLVNVLTHGLGSPMPGLLGGQPGGQARLDVEGARVVTEEGTSTLVELRRATDAIVLQAAGGSGFGDPAARPDALLARDLAEGYVTPAGLAAYGRPPDPRARSSDPRRKGG
jgi:5-oxoprolinase (ATP-hydrolysing)/N-methylhydantoinase A